MFAQHGFVIPFKKNAMFPYSEQVQDCEFCEFYNTSVGDDFVAKNN